MKVQIPHVELDDRVKDENTSFYSLIEYFCLITGYSFSNETKMEMARWLENHYNPEKTASSFSKFYFTRKLFLIFATRKYQKNDKELPTKEDFYNDQQENPEKKRIETQFDALGSDEQFQV